MSLVYPSKKTLIVNVRQQHKYTVCNSEQQTEKRTDLNLHVQIWSFLFHLCRKTAEVLHRDERPPQDCSPVHVADWRWETDGEKRGSWRESSSARRTVSLVQKHWACTHTQPHTSHKLILGVVCAISGSYLRGWVYLCYVSLATLGCFKLLQSCNSTVSMNWFMHF